MSNSHHAFSIELIEDLFVGLKDAKYYHIPMTPDQLLNARKMPQNFSALTRLFGLGLSVDEKEISAELDVHAPNLTQALLFSEFIKRENRILTSEFAIS